MGDHTSSSDDRGELRWPQTLRATKVRGTAWFHRLRGLGPRLTLRQAAHALQQPYASVSFWCQVFGYPFAPVRRGRKSTVDWDRADWSKKNCDLARELHVCSERVRQVRQLRDLPPAQRLSGGSTSFRAYVSANKHRLDGMSVRQIIARCQISISIATAHMVLKQCGVRLHAHLIPWDDVNWELGDGDLAKVWKTHRSYVARVRRRRGAAAPRWDGPAVDPAADADHHRALVLEQRNAQTRRRGA